MHPSGWTTGKGIEHKTGNGITSLFLLPEEEKEQNIGRARHLSEDEKANIDAHVDQM